MVSVDRVYATSLMDIAYKENLQDVILNELLSIKNSISENKDIIKLMHSPILKKTEKEDVLDKIFNGKVNNYTLNFLKVISSNNRFNDVISIIDEVKEEYNDRNNISEVEVQTAVLLTKEQSEKLLSKLEKKLNKKVIIKNKLNPEILGGAVIKLKNEQVDASVKKSLNDIFNIISVNMG